MELKLDIGNSSDVGKVREVNEDYFGSFTGSYGTLLIVCDGMGGYKGGETASQLAVETVHNHFDGLPEKFNVAAEINKALQSANNSITKSASEDSELSEMGSTIVLILIKDGIVNYTNLGDSRIYRIRGEKIEQLTRDHSLVQKMIDSNIISEDEAINHPKKNVITKALGTDKDAEPELYEPFNIQENDKLILCSDGLTTHVNSNEILNIVSTDSPQDAANRLVLLANERGGTDNITVQVLSADMNESNEKKESRFNLYLLYTILLISLGVLIYLLFSFEIIRFGSKEKQPVTIDKPSTPAEVGTSNKRHQVGIIDSISNSADSIKDQNNLLSNPEEEINNEENNNQ